jgi:hypothetical protein
VEDREGKDAITFRWPIPAGTVICFLVGLGFLLLVLLLPSSEFGLAWFYRLAWIYLGVMFLVMPVSVYFDPAQGTFRLDHEGIHQVPLLRTPRHLRWDNVRRVKWGEHTCCFEGKETSISMKFVAASRHAKAFVETALSPHFDLSIKSVRQWSFDPNVRSFLRWLSKVIVISISGTALFIVPFAILIFLNASRWIGAVWFGLVLLGIIGFVGRGAREFSRKEEQINPTWRLRRTEGGLDSH